jgi:ribosomal protein S18 acetylase RimI-like enzyme
LKSSSNLNDAYTIRRAGINDVSAITDITNQAYAKWIAAIGRKPLPMMVDYAQAVQNHVIDLCEVGGVIVALIEMIEERDHLMIENLAVVPAYQGQGFGTLLLEHAHEIAVSRGTPMIRLLTNAKFESNVEFYKRNQFVVDREEPFMGGVTVHMRKAVA